MIELSKGSRMLHRNIGKVLAKRRVQRGLRQEEMAEELGVTARSVSNIESGKPCNSRILFAYIERMGLLQEIVYLFDPTDYENVKRRSYAKRTVEESH
jgi:transcriptional regulator with XRE-family HTH domain